MFTAQFGMATVLNLYPVGKGKTVKDRLIDEATFLAPPDHGNPQVKATARPGVVQAVPVIEVTLEPTKPPCLHNTMVERPDCGYVYGQDADHVMTQEEAEALTHKNPPKIKPRKLPRRKKSQDRPLNELARHQFVQAICNAADIYRQHRLDETYNFDDHVELLKELHMANDEDVLQGIAFLLRRAVD